MVIIEYITIADDDHKAFYQYLTKSSGNSKNKILNSYSLIEKDMDW